MSSGWSCTDLSAKRPSVGHGAVDAPGSLRLSAEWQGRPAGHWAMPSGGWPLVRSTNFLGAARPGSQAIAVSRRGFAPLPHFCATLPAIGLVSSGPRPSSSKRQPRRAPKVFHELRSVTLQAPFRDGSLSLKSSLFCYGVPGGRNSLCPLPKILPIRSVKTVGTK